MSSLAEEVNRPVAVRHAILVVGFFLAVTAFYTFPLILHSGDRLLIGLGDYPTETSMVVWNAQQTFRDPSRLFQPPFYYPYGNGVAYQQSAFFSGLLAAPVLGRGAEPILAVNLVLLAELVASGVLTYVLAYSITGRVGPSLLAGVVFAFYPNRMDHIGQFTYQQAFLFPLVVWAAYRFLLRGRWRDLVLAAGGLWAQMLSSLYNGYALSLLLVALAAAILLLRPECLTWRFGARAAVAGLALALALLPFALPYMAVHGELGFQRVLDEGEYFGMDLLSILDPGEFSRLYRNRLVSLHRAEGGMFPGFVALALAAAAVLFALPDPGSKCAATRDAVGAALLGWWSAGDAGDDRPGPRLRQRPGQAPLPPKPWRGGRGGPALRVRRTARHHPVSLKRLAAKLPASAWQTVTWREGTREAMRSRFARLRVRPAHRDEQRSDPRPEQWLVIEWPRGESAPMKYSRRPRSPSSSVSPSSAGGSSGTIKSSRMNSAWITSKGEAGAASIITALCASRRMPSSRPNARPFPPLSLWPSSAPLAFPKVSKARGAHGAA